MQKIFILISLIIIIACEDNIISPSVKNESYKSFYPVKTGNEFIYNITQIEIDEPSNYYDTSIYQVKEVFSKYFIDNAGDTAIIIDRYYRESETDTWQKVDVWYANLYDNELQVIEENQRIVKLKNPIELHIEWDGNKYNQLDTLKEYMFHINRIATEEVNNQFFDSTITVIQRYDSSLIEKNIHKELYAKNIGLVYKEKSNINSQNTNQLIPIEQRITRATIYRQQLISYIHVE